MSVISLFWALARRIVCYSEVNKDIKACHELGFIKFGSRVYLFLPIGTNIISNLNDKTEGFKTIIGTSNN